MLRRADLAPYIWGALDALIFVMPVYADLAAGEVPFVTDFRNLLVEAERLEYPEMVYPAIGGLILYASLPISCGLLLLRRSAGAILSAFQAPLRIVLVTPSIPFVLGLSVPFVPPENKPLMAGVGLGLCAVIEAIRLATLFRWRRASSAV